MTTIPPAEQRMLKRKVNSCCRRNAEAGVSLIKAISNIEFSPVILRKLRKAVAAGKKKRALVASKANATSASAFERSSGVGGEARSSCDSPQLRVRKRKAEELSSSDCPSEPAAALRPGIR